VNIWTLNNGVRSDDVIRGGANDHDDDEDGEESTMREHKAFWVRYVNSSEGGAINIYYVYIYTHIYNICVYL